MNIKAYLDYFEEISDLPRDEQFTLLDKAHALIQEGSVVSKFSLVSVLVPLFVILALVGGGTLLFGVSVLVIIMSVVFSLLLSRVIVNELNTSILQKSLKRVLVEQEARN